MPQDYEVCGYQYRATYFCIPHVIREYLTVHGLEGHGLSYKNEEALDLLARFDGIDRQNEHSFDTDDFPKVIYGYQAEDADAHCDWCGKHLRDCENDSWMNKGVSKREGVE